MTPIIAIDPGANGGIAYRSDEGLTECYPMPATDPDVCDLLTELLSRSKSTIAIVEQVGGYIGGKGNTGSTMFTFGFGTGYIHGVLYARGIPLELVAPKRWQSTLHLGKKDADSEDAKKDWKNKLKTEAQRRYPGLKVTLKTADALLILAYKLATDPEVR